MGTTSVTTVARLTLLIHRHTLRLPTQTSLVPRIIILDSDHHIRSRSSYWIHLGTAAAGELMRILQTVLAYVPRAWLRIWSFETMNGYVPHRDVVLQHAFILGSSWWYLAFYIIRMVSQSRSHSNSIRSSHYELILMLTDTFAVQPSRVPKDVSPFLNI